MKAARKGQIGPMTLEDLFPMTVAVISVFVFIAYIYSLVGNGLEGSRAVTSHKISEEITSVLYNRGPFLYGNDSGLFDSKKLDAYMGLYSELEATYGVSAYGFSATVRDLRETERQWSYSPPSVGAYSLVASTPVAIRYPTGNVNEGVLEVRVWKK